MLLDYVLNVFFILTLGLSMEQVCSETLYLCVRLHSVITRVKI